MKTIAASKFKEQCLSLLDRLGPEGLIITKRGKPVARVMPERSPHTHLIGSLRGKMQIKGDIMSTGRKWESHA